MFYLILNKFNSYYYITIIRYDNFYLVLIIYLYPIYKYKLVI